MVGAVERKLETKDKDKKSNSQAQYARAGQVNVYGLNQKLWDLTNHDQAPRPTGKQVILSGRLAKNWADQSGRHQAGGSRR